MNTNKREYRIRVRLDSDSPWMYLGPDDPQIFTDSESAHKAAFDWLYFRPWLDCQYYIETREVSEWQ